MNCGLLMTSSIAEFLPTGVLELGVLERGYWLEM
jgi:hypothetical protein